MVKNYTVLWKDLVANLCIMHPISFSICFGFRYQVYVSHFFISAEEMACLATWKEGSSRYLVSMLNHSHVYTDEARYRCFVYQRQHSNENGAVTYKMAQSLFASCLGLWNVNEGYKTFTMTKCKYLKGCRQNAEYVIDRVVVGIAHPNELNYYEFYFWKVPSFSIIIWLFVA